MEYDIKDEYIKIIQSKLALSDYDAALNNAQKLVKYSPDCAEGYYFIGLCEFALGDFETSINNYEKCIELKHDYAKAYYNLGVTKYYLNHYKEALNYVEYAYRIFVSENDSASCNKCLESIEYIKEEQGL